MFYRSNPFLNIIYMKKPVKENLMCNESVSIYPVWYFLEWITR